MYSYGPLHMAKQKQDDQLEHTYSSYVRIQDVALKTCQRRWTIRRSGERGSGISVLAARHDDDDVFIQVIWLRDRFIRINEVLFRGLHPISYNALGYPNTIVAERTSYFCLARKLIKPLWSSHIFTQRGWPILFSPDHFPGQHKNGESPPNYLFLRTFRAWRTYFLSAPFIGAESQNNVESRQIYGPFESTLLDQGFPVEHEFKCI